MMKKTLLAAAAAALLLAACGTAETDDGVVSLETDTTTAIAVQDTNEATAEDMTDEESLLLFAACMRENGFAMEDPTVDSDGNLQLRRPANSQDEGFDFDTARAALAECEYLLDGVNLGFRGADATELEDDLLAWASCMRDNGYDVDDPDFTAFGPGGGGDGPGGGGGGRFGDIDLDDLDFQVAQAVCEDLLPGFGGFRRGGG